MFIDGIRKYWEERTAVLPPRLLVRAIEDLLAYASAFEPQTVFGVNRGGSIVGGAIAKRLGILPYLLEVDYKNEGSDRVIEHRANPRAPLPGRRLMIVDDVLHTGRHMRLALEYSRATYPEAEVRTAVLLRFLKTNHEACDYWALSTQKKVKLPWEPR